jgi:hypothetical protein
MKSRTKTTKTPARPTRRCAPPMGPAAGDDERRLRREVAAGARRDCRAILASGGARVSSVSEHVSGLGVHTKLTIREIDKINGCQTRLLTALVLLDLGLEHLDDDWVETEMVTEALRDVVGRLREDVTLIGALIDLAGPEPPEPARTDGVR